VSAARVASPPDERSWDGMTYRMGGEGWLEPGEWVRHGRGRDWQFQLPTEQIVETLQKTAAAFGEELGLLVCSRTHRGKESFSVYSSQRLASLTVEGPWQYFLRLPSVTPAIPAPEPLMGVGWPAIFAINGLVLLHHPDPGRRTDPPPSSIGVTHRVVSKRTGERREHDEYDRLFKTLKRNLQAALAAG
jgi:hypothetical protein